MEAALVRTAPDSRIVSQSGSGSREPLVPAGGRSGRALPRRRRGLRRARLRRRRAGLRGARAHRRGVRFARAGPASRHARTASAGARSSAPHRRALCGRAPCAGAGRRRSDAHHRWRRPAPRDRAGAIRGRDRGRRARSRHLAARRGAGLADAHPAGPVGARAAGGWTALAGRRGRRGDGRAGEPRRAAVGPAHPTPVWSAGFDWGWRRAGHGAGSRRCWGSRRRCIRCRRSSWWKRGGPPATRRSSGSRCGRGVRCRFGRRSGQARTIVDEIRWSASKQPAHRRPSERAALRPM